ncbi:PAS domain S-box protein [Paenibacillus ginsengarvi]|nr:PAS domain S-box protein [Paenibacillus ginsengarvi]
MARKKHDREAADAFVVSAFRHAPIGMALVEVSGRFRQVNEKFAGLVGYDEKELLGMNFIDITHPDDLYKDIIHADLALAGKQDSYRMKKRYIHKRGYYVRVLLSCSIVRDSQRNPLYFVAYVQRLAACIDPGERKPSRRKELQRLVTEQSQNLIISCSSDLSIRSVSSEIMTVLGYGAEEVIGWKLDDLLHPEDASQLQGIQEGSMTCTNRYLHKDHKYVWFESTYRFVRESPRTPGFVLAYGRDITERKQAEELLELQMEQYRQLVENSPDAVLILAKQKGLYINKMGIRLLGGDTEEDRRTILGDPYRFAPIPDQKQDGALLRREADGDEEKFYELKLVRLDGQTIEAEARSVPTLFQNEPAVYTIIRDMTERKKTMELLHHSEKLSAAGQLAAGIAHEIRNPLTAIRGFHQLMQTNGLKKEYFDIMAAEMDRIEMILTELLVLAKPQEVKIKQADIVSLLVQVTALLESQAIMTGCRLCIDSEQPSLFFRCDENQIKQVFINLIKNAIEAMPDGGDVTIRLKAEADKLIIRVSDEGQGIDEQLLRRVGQPFYTTKQDGTGLGLMITNKIIENHGGTMSIESAVGAGTTFTIVFPGRFQDDI